MNILGDPEFKLEDIHDVNWGQVNDLLATDKEGEWVDNDTGWVHTPVTISVLYQPCCGVPSNSQAGPRNYVVDNFYYRSLVSVIHEKISGMNAANHHLFHMEPYEMLWQTENHQQPVCVQGELYTLPSFVDAYQKLQDSPPEPGCNLLRAIIALMFWFDVTPLTSFGNAKLWPLYLFFGNKSKYRRCKPLCHLCEHLPDSFKDFATAQTAGGKAPSPALMTHCSRELFHAQWKVLLDDNFLQAWKHGIMILCADDINHQFYPRIFTYSADYPKKILIVSIHNLGKCPCPHCLIPLNCVCNLGMARDMTQRDTMARVDNVQRHSRIEAVQRLIYEKNFMVNSAAVEKILRDTSLVPTANAFSNRLLSVGFNFHSMLLPDLMHEVEIGGWKALLIHLLRMLQSVNDQLLVELDRG
ncbi:hypothetical protein PILCRDRAFT_68884 [Piloderma croceum F 1598]|uniref:Uncharacterized protein n=1 Tax=Piloderma croceum (strain F 1598) TaxID=765440 RepID=A0A0C3FWA0_PILCF|nr:hypothetical protein PILCRDRAFT_68884 [Piloderma croceum F 1598]